jgi:uncharacterized protein YjbJ (UPF0337 family)
VRASKARSARLVVPESSAQSEPDERPGARTLHSWLVPEVTSQQFRRLSNITKVKEQKMADTTRKTGDQNQVEGAAKERGGKIRGTVGDITDNRDQHLKGKVDELKGKAQKNLGNAQEKLENLDKKY